MTFPAEEQEFYFINWDEDNLRWIGVKKSDDSNHRWDADNAQWVSL